MTREEFLATFKGKPPAAWENAVVEMAKRGEIVRWPLAEVVLRDEAGRSLAVHVTTDMISVGTVAEPLRMPLTPIACQRIADTFGMLLPTPAIVKAIMEQAPVKMTMRGLVPNKGANLEQYAEHNDIIERKLRETAGGDDPSLLRSGHKKVVVLSGPALMKPRVVVIYGGGTNVPVPPGIDRQPTVDAPWRVQPLSNVHGDYYDDYSHDTYLMAPTGVLTDTDGSVREVTLATDIFPSAELSGLVNPKGPPGGGPLAARYPVAPGGAPIAYIPERPSFADRGLSEVKERTLERFGSKS